MNAPDQTPKFAPGFRLSLRDAIVLVVGIGATIGFYQTTWEASLIIAFVVSHFFLFCNVFRVSRLPELIWAGIFLILTGGTLMANIPGWAVTIMISLATTVVVIALEMKGPSYHGVGWRSINPNLKSWWDAEATGAPR